VDQDRVITYRAIGWVENGFKERAAPEAIAAGESRIVLDPALADGLDGLQAGQRLLVLFHFDRSQGYELRQHHRGDPDQPLRGVFALHSPRRPNPIGATVVDLLAIEGHVLRVRGLDALDGTPVLDLKPA